MFYREAEEGAERARAVVACRRRRAPAWSLLGVLSVLVFAGPLYAQVPGGNPGGEYKGPEHTVAAFNAPLAQINAALREAGRPEIDPLTASLPHPDSVTLYVEVPIPKQKNRLLTRPKMPTPPMVGAVPPPAAAAPAAAAAPSTLITGLNFDDNAALTGGFLFIPPDPSGAVGTSHVCHVVNVSIQCQAKDGTAVPGFPLSLATFFASLSPQNFTFDPKILYDQFEDRYVAITLEKTDVADGDPSNTSHIFLAVSDDGDPSGAGWHYQSIDALLSIGGADRWCDYPGFAVDEEAIYVTCNYFGFSGGGFAGLRTWIIDKGVSGGLYGGATSTVNVYDPVAMAGAGSATTSQPAHIYGTPPAGATGTWLVSYSGLTDGINEYLQIYRIDTPLSAPTFSHNYVFVGNFDNNAVAMPDAPQPGTASLIDTGDRRSLNAAWRDNVLWSTATVVPPSGADAGQATAYYFKTSTTGAPSSLASGGVGGEDVVAGAYTYYPSLAVDSEGNIGIGFAASHGTLYAGAYFVTRDGGSGTLSPTETVKVGEDYYNRTFGGPRNRWGDYTRVALDPTDEALWVINEVALPRGTATGPGEDGRWGVFLGRFAPLVLPVELTAFSALSDGRDVLLQWQTASETNNAGFEIQGIPNNAGAEWAVLGWVEGHGTTLEAQHYTHRLEDLPPGAHRFRLKQIDYDGTFDFSPEVEVFIEIPSAYVLSDAFPNPFNPQAQFTLMLAATQHVTVEVFDALGRRAALLHEGLLEADRRYRFTFDARRLPSGLYFYRVAAERFTATKAMTLAK